MPYAYYYMTYKNQELRRIDFPLSFFEKKRKYYLSKDTLSSIYSNLPMQIKHVLKKKQMVGPYLLALFLSMQSGTTR